MRVLQVSCEPAGMHGQRDVCDCTYRLVHDFSVRIAGQGSSLHFAEVLRVSECCGFSGDA